MNKKTLYLQAYQILNQATPLRKDCGSLCNKACCHGLDHLSGMYLYPGEEELQYLNSFMRIESTNIQGRSVLLAICNQECDRLIRPLACRVFPLTAYYTLKDLLTIIMDPQARSLCPLARNLAKADLTMEFVTKVRQTFRLLCADPEIRQFVIQQSRVLDEFVAIASQFSQ
jgi:hypothetical protein